MCNGVLMLSRPRGCFVAVRNDCSPSTVGKILRWNSIPETCALDDKDISERSGPGRKSFVAQGCG